MTLPPSGPIHGTTLFDRVQNFRISRGQAVRWAFSIKLPDGSAADLDGRVFTWRMFDAGAQVAAFPGALSNDRRSVGFVLTGAQTLPLQNGLRHRLDEDTADGPVPWLEGWVRVRAGTAAPLGNSNGPVETISRSATTETVAIQSKGGPGEAAGEQLKRALDAAGRGDEMPDSSDTSFLAFVDKVAAAIAERQVNGAGLVSGGGALTSNLQLKVEAASNDDAIAGTSTTKAVTPKAMKAAIDTQSAAVLALTGAALDKRPRVDAEQLFSDLETAQARANIKAASQLSVDAALDEALGRVAPSIDLPAPAILTVSTGLVREMEDGEVFDQDLRRLEITSEYDTGALISLRNRGYDATAVTEVAADMLDLSQVDGSTGPGILSRVTRILAIGHKAKVGQPLKIASNDPLPKQHILDPTGTLAGREGEFFTVAKVDGPYIYTTHRLFGTYTTGVFIVRPSNARVNIQRALIGYGGNNKLASAISLRGFLNCILNVGLIHDFLAPAINLIGCYYPRVQGGRIENLRNNGGYVGYGINDVSCFGMIVTMMQFYFLRHGYTSNCNRTLADDLDWYQRGRSWGALVSNSIGVGCAGPFDSHPDALDLTFANLKAVGSPRMQDSSGAAFQMRGARWTASDLVSIRNKVGFLAYLFAEELLAGRGILNGFESYDDETSLRLQGLGGRIADFLLSGITIDTSALSPIDFAFAKIRARDMAVRFGVDTPDSSRLFNLASTQLTVDKLDADYNAVASATHRLYRPNDAGSVIRLPNVQINEGGSQKLSAIADHGNLKVDAEIAYTKDTTAPIGFSNKTADSTLKLRAIDGVAHRRYVDYTAIAGTQTIDLSDNAWEHIWLRITCTVPGAVILLQAPKERGQRVTAQGRDTNTEPFTLGGLAGGSVAGIAPRTSVTVTGDAAFNWQVGNRVGLRGSKSFDWPSIAAGGTASTTVTVTGAAAGDVAIASMSSGSGGLFLFAEGTSSNTDTVRAFNPTAAAIDLPAGTLAVFNPR